MLRISLIFCFIGVIIAQTPGLGSCPSVSTMDSFQVDKFFGDWYENRRNLPNFFEAESKCVKVTYSKNNTNAINIVKYRSSWLTGNPSYLNGTATLDAQLCQNSRSGCSKYLYKIRVPLVGDFELPYWVVDTDYVSYALVYSCMQKLGVHATYLWVLTREQYPALSVLEEVKRVMTHHGLQNVPTLEVDQANCAA